jgi:hypothetical protein
MLYERTLVRGHKIHKAEQVGISIQSDDLFQTALRAGIGHEPVMNNSGFQRVSLLSGCPLELAYANQRTERIVYHLFR